jgi:AcrR family transcriptional regulator
LAQRERLSAEERRDRLVAAAARLVVETGSRDVSYDALARAAGVSRSGAYAAFPSHADLTAAVLAREYVALAQLEAAAGLADGVEAARRCADIYFARVAAEGPVAHVLEREGGAPPPWRDRLFRRLARRLRRDLALPAREAVATLSLLLVIPEDAGRLVWTGELSTERGAELCSALVTAALAGLGRE